MADTHAHREEVEDTGRGAGVVFGILLMLLGIWALSSLFVTAYASIFFLSWILMIGGVIRIVEAFWGRGWSTFFLYLTTGLLMGFGGFLLLNNPTVGLATVTLLLAFMFIVQGFMSVISSLAIRYKNWGWSLAYGIIVFFLGLAIWRHWPYYSVQLIGLMVGLELVIAGITMVVGSLSPQKASTPTTTAVAV